MVAIGSKRFDPAEHLTKQGWKGKGTALKTGHLTRPLAVIQKKTLSGVGKDRDEAVPFWDQIFAATAASLSLPSTPLSPSPASTPPHTTTTSTLSVIPRLADPRSNKSGSWQTSGSSGSASANQQPLGQPGLSVGVRIARDVARRGLYSRFFRGEDVAEPELEESGAKVEVDGGAGPRLGSGSSEAPAEMEIEAGPSRLGGAVEPDGLEVEGVKKTKEEKRARRAAKAQRKMEKAERKALQAEERAAAEATVEPPSELPSVDELAVGSGVEDAKTVKKRKRREEKAENSAGGAAVTEEGEGPILAEVKEKKKKKKRKDND